MSRTSMSRTSRNWVGALVVAALTALGMGLAPGASGRPVGRADSAPPAPKVIPAPVSLQTGTGTFALGPWTTIVASSRGAVGVARDLASELRPATGFPLPVVAGGRHGRGSHRWWRGGPSRITLTVAHPAVLSGHPDGYRLQVSTRRVELSAPSAAGLFHGAQTIRQLLPGWIDSPTPVVGPWTMPAVSIIDYPRYAYRGVMVDIARHFEPPSAVERIIDVASEYKMNTLHLHLSDDQGFRVAINGFPRLTSIGAQGSVGTHGRPMDPGGYWTQRDYRQVVRYAAAHFMTVVPEVDSPSHNNAIVMSEYNDTANPLLDGNPQDINCGDVSPPEWNYSTAVGYSGMCPDSSNTWAIYTAIIDQLSAMSSSPYYDLGGDEAHPFTPAKYSEFINKETPIVQAAGKTPMGWADGFATTAGTNPPAGSVAEAWMPGASDGAAAVRKGMKVIMSPADHAYLDQSYPNDHSGLGLGWACRGCDLDVNYNWDPGAYPGVPDSSVIGVEGALWSETIPTLADAEYLLLPRLMAIAEIGWSPKADRSGPTSAAFQDFVARVAAQGSRLQAAGLNFYTTTQVPWRLDGTAVYPHRRTRDELGVVSAPGYAPGDVTATVTWGDGSTTDATVTGTAPSPGRVNGLYAISAQHPRGGARPATVTVTAGSQSTSFRTWVWAGRRHR